eukprot:4365821-Pyramimonas_sp.AAC.1
MEVGAISGHALPRQPWPKRKGDKSGGGKGDKIGGKGDSGGKGSKETVNTDKHWRQKQGHKEKGCRRKAAGKPRAPPAAPPKAAA